MSDSSPTPPRSMSRRKKARPGIVNYVFYQNDQMGRMAFMTGAAVLRESISKIVISNIS